MEAVVVRLSPQGSFTGLAVFTASPFAYYILPEWIFSTTLGKAIAGTTVVRLDYRACDFGRAFLRNAFRWIDMFCLGWVLILMSASRRRSGEYLAKTIVICQPIGANARMVLVLGWLGLAGIGLLASGRFRV